jgi:phosphonatase-like hydrolase
MLDYYTNDPSVQPVAGAEEVFHTLRQQGVKVALDTGFDRSIVAAILKRLCWSETVIDASVSSDEVTQGRPNADMILRAMELTNVADPALVAKVGDTPSDLLEGTNAGCRYVIGVTAGSHTREELEQFPHTHLVSTVTDVPPILLSGR